MEDDNISADGVISDILSAELDATVPPHLRGPLTRSKSRLLFPTSEQLAAKEKKSLVTDDEEAMTERELSNEVSPPPEETNEEVFTPVAPKFTPATPPSTAHRTRSMRFDGAADRHLKNLSVTPTRGKKREGGRIARVEVTKKPRATRRYVA